MDKRDQIITTAAQLIHEHGYHNVGIQKILNELNIPKGSFYYYFKSKEDLGLAIIDLYVMDTKGGIEAMPNTLDGLKSFFNIFFDRLIQLSMKRGCPVGNLILELADEKESFRERLMLWYKSLENWSTEILQSEGIDDAHNKSRALISAFEGAMMLSKLEKDSDHFKIFNEVTFQSIVRRA